MIEKAAQDSERPYNHHEALEFSLLIDDRGCQVREHFHGCKGEFVYSTLESTCFIKT